jgi:hypothetical protein
LLVVGFPLDKKGLAAGQNTKSTSFMLAIQRILHCYGVAKPVDPHVENKPGSNT